MTRSFTDRVFGGVCGGLAGSLPVSAWALRGLFILLLPLSLGVAGLLYLGLWFLLPQESLIADLRGAGLRFLLVLAFVMAVLMLTLARDAAWMQGPTGESLFLPALALLLSTVFFLRQVRA